MITVPDPVERFSFGLKFGQVDGEGFDGNSQGTGGRGLRARAGVRHRVDGAGFCRDKFCACQETGFVDQDGSQASHRFFHRSQVEPSEDFFCQFEDEFRQDAHRVLGKAVAQKIGEGARAAED